MFSWLLIVTVLLPFRPTDNIVWHIPRRQLDRASSTAPVYLHHKSAPVTNTYIDRVYERPFCPSLGTLESSLHFEQLILLISVPSLQCLITTGAICHWLKWAFLPCEIIKNEVRNAGVAYRENISFQSQLIFSNFFENVPQKMRL